MSGQARRVWSGMLRMICVAAILSLAFAHKPPQVMAAVMQSASLQLPDGSFADICISETAIKHPVAALHCEVCMLASATLLPSPDDEAWLVARVASLVSAPPIVVKRAAPLPIDRPRSRAPPTVS